MDACPACRRQNPRNFCGHCRKIAYCSQQCADVHFPVHIGILLSVQIEFIPPVKHRLLTSVYRHRENMVPYDMDALRFIIDESGGDVAEFDALVKGVIDYKRSKVQDLEKLTFDSLWGWGFKNDTGKTTISVEEEVFDGVWRHLISPFVSAKTLESVIPILKKITSTALDERMSVLEKTKEVKQALQDIFLGSDEYCVQPGDFFAPSVKGVDDDLWMFAHPAIIKMLHDAVKRIRKMYARPEIIFPTYTSQTYGITVTTVPKGTFLYRGFPRDLNGNGLDENASYNWFAFDFITTLGYVGIPNPREYENRFLGKWRALNSGVAVFKTKRDISVLDFTKVESVRYMQEAMKLMGAPEKLLEAFKRGWNIEKDTRKVDRNSYNKEDAKIVAWLCEMKWDGYIGYGLERFHDELLLCDAEEKVKLVKKLDVKNDFFPLYGKATHPLQEHAQLVLE